MSGNGGASIKINTNKHTWIEEGFLVGLDDFTLSINERTLDNELNFSHKYISKFKSDNEEFKIPLASASHITISLQLEKDEESINKETITDIVRFMEKNKLLQKLVI